MTKNILIYDVGTLPKGKTMQMIVDEYNNGGVVTWCSAAAHNFAGKNLEGNKPTVISRDTLEQVDSIKFIDISEQK